MELYVISKRYKSIKKNPVCRSIEADETECFYYSIWWFLNLDTSNPACSAEFRQI